MATIRIMPLHVGKGRTESRAISDITDYVATGRVRGADDVIAYHVRHVRQSFRPGEITPEEANRLGVEFARQFGVLVPGTARPLPNGTFVLIAGHRRKQASAFTGPTDVPKAQEAMGNRHDRAPAQDNGTLY